MKKKTYNKLQKEYTDLARQAKKQIKEIKKAGYKKSPAENVLIGRLPSSAVGEKDNLLIKPRKRSKDVYEKGIIELKKFLQFKTSTKEGYEQLLEDRRKQFREEFSDAEKMNNSQIDEFLEFLGNEKVKSAKENYDSDQLIKMLVKQKIKDNKLVEEKIKNNEDAEEKSVFDLYEDFKDRNTTIADELRELEKSSKNDFIKL